jgi:hypothetical protein
MKSIVPIEVIEKKILLIGGQKVMLDRIMRVTTKPVWRSTNLKRFPGLHVPVVNEIRVFKVALRP